MKRLIFTLLLLVNFMFSKAQTTNAFLENFDGATVNFNSQGTPGWTVDPTYWVSGPNCWRGQYTNAATPANPVLTTSTTFVTTGSTYIILKFDQICKIEFTDTAKIEVSTDNGTTWTKLDASPTGNCVYNGTGNFVGQQNKFSEQSYLLWAPGTGTAPLNTWWQHEEFDISQLVGNSPTVQVRFSLVDFSGNGMGVPARYGWLLDNVNVVQSPCELVPPVIYPDHSVQTYLGGTVFNLGPFDPQFIIHDNSSNFTTITSELYWSVNGGTWQQFGGMFNIDDSTWIGEFGPFNDLDTICWYATATDSCGNMGSFGTQGSPYCFNVTTGIHFPYCDNFDVGSQIWAWDSINSTPGSTPWLLGVPNSGSLTTPHSPPNVWGCGLTGGYVNSSTSYLELIPPLDFGTYTLANLFFWHNHNTESGWDGVRMEYSFDNITWNMLGDLNSQGNGDATNWYNSNVNSSNLPAWNGNSGNWVQSSFKLGSPNVIPAIVGQSQVYFRYVFTSDPSVTRDGFHLDDFCVKIPCPDDIGLDAFTTPLNGAGSPVGSSLTVSVNLENFGLNPQSNITINYTMNGGAPLSTLVAGPLAPGVIQNVALQNTPPVLAGSNILKAWTSLPGDCDLTNDTVTITIVGIPTLPLTYCDDFESGNVGWSAQNDPAGNAGTNWEFGTPAFGQTTGANSGVTAWDINLTSGYTSGALSYLYTPYLDFSTVSNGRMTFAINYNTSQQEDGAYIEYTLNGGTSWQQLGAVGDVCGTNWYDANLFSNGKDAWTGTSGTWKNVAYKLCCASPSPFGNTLPVQFRFVFASSTFTTGDGVSIDDFCVYSSTGDDVGVSAITSPVGGAPVGNMVNVVVTLENFGSNVVHIVPIEYEVNGVPPLHDTTWVGTLNPCQSTTMTLPKFSVTQGNNIIKAYTQLTTDIQHSNDTSVTSFIGQPIDTLTYQKNYFDDFESGNVGWAPEVINGGDPNTIWELGYPAWQSTTGCYNSPFGTGHAWDVNLTTAPNPNAFCVLTTPYFDFASAQSAVLEFYQNRSIYQFGDEFYIEYAINGSNNWTKLDITNNQLTTNWYNNAGGGAWWDNVSGGWIHSVFKDVPSAIGGILPTLVQFRFVYTSAGFTTADGVSIDNFEIYVPIPLTISPQSVNTSVPNQLIFPGQPITFAVPVLNNGVNGVFNHTITLVIDGNIVTTDPVSYGSTPLAPDSIKIHNFAQTWIAVPGFHQVCAYTSMPNGTQDLSLWDDTVCTTVLVFDSVATSGLPYCNSFESGTQWVTANALSYRNSSSFQLGTPNQTYLNGAHTGTKAWTLLLDSNYLNRDSSGLFSSLFRVEPGHCYKLSYWQEFRMEYGSDGGAVDVSTDYGASWKQLDYTGTPGTVLFGPNTDYTYVVSLDPANYSEKGWTGNRNNWFKAEKVIRPDTSTQLIVRWRFASDYTGREEGWSIDDVCFEDLGVCTPLGINEYAVNDFGISQNYPNPSADLTTFEYVIPSEGAVKITVMNVYGQIVDVLTEGTKGSGKHTVDVNTAKYASGIYTYTLYYNNEQLTKRMVVTK